MQAAYGLGLEAQRAAVRWCGPDPTRPGAEFIEVKGGKQNQRPHLLSAVAEALAAK